MFSRLNGKRGLHPSGSRSDELQLQYENEHEPTDDDELLERKEHVSSQNGWWSITRPTRMKPALEDSAEFWVAISVNEGLEAEKGHLEWEK